MNHATITNALFVQTNAADANQVLVFGREDDGSLDTIGAYETGGRGTGTPHLPSQGSLILSDDHRLLLVANAGSDDISVFALREAGLTLLATTASGGAAPRSIAVAGDLVYALNTGDPSLTGFRLVEGGIEPLEGSRRELAAGADPAQVGFSPNASMLVVTERGTNSITTFPVGSDGRLGEPHTQPSSGPTPYGFAFSGDNTLVVTEAFGAQVGKAAASSYVVGTDTVEPVTRSLGNGRSEICWAVVTKDGRFAYTTNFADGAVSRYAIGHNGRLTLDDPAAGIAVDGHAGLRDEELSSDGRFLYAIDADAQRIFGWAVGDDGSLTGVGSWAGVPDTVAGLAAS
jgi:6-phosphogluconolactonase